MENLIIILVFIILGLMIAVYNNDEVKNTYIIKLAKLIEEKSLLIDSLKELIEEYKKNKTLNEQIIANWEEIYNQQTIFLQLKK